MVNPYAENPRVLLISSHDPHYLAMPRTRDCVESYANKMIYKKDRFTRVSTEVQVIFFG